VLSFSSPAGLLEIRTTTKSNTHEMKAAFFDVSIAIREWIGRVVASETPSLDLIL